MSDPLGDIEIKEEPTYGEEVIEAIPLSSPVTEAVKAVSDGFSTGDVETLFGSGADFISSCADMAGEFLLDPIGTLVGQGLEFLLAICQPLQDLIQLVTGDGGSLERAAENFGAIGQGLNDFAEQFASEADEFLASWHGPAADAAAEKLAAFAVGIRGVAGEAGNIARLLQLSSIIMKVIEEFIMALLTELITWLLMIWIPALAASAVTFGGSTAAAGAATAVRATQTTSRATKQVNWLRKLLDKIKEVLGKLRDWLAKQGRTVREAMEHKRNVVREATDAIDNGPGRGTWAQRLHHEQNGMIGQRVEAGFRESMRGVAKDSLNEHLGVDSWAGHAESIGSGVEYGEIGEDQSTSQTSRQLDL
ncbi:hypothetical protein AB8O38_08775 [Saccharomonospora xinjiangensis]|uniref:hypothetical protein n=1 Tax=Saccharomonospora xinjiangensis TaxID=75294 RepID=UPI00350F5FC5